MVNIVAWLKLFKCEKCPALFIRLHSPLVNSAMIPTVAAITFKQGSTGNRFMHGTGTLHHVADSNSSSKTSLFFVFRVENRCHKNLAWAWAIMATILNHHHRPKMMKKDPGRTWPDPMALFWSQYIHVECSMLLLIVDGSAALCFMYNLFIGPWLSALERVLRSYANAGGSKVQVTLVTKKNSCGTDYAREFDARGTSSQSIWFGLFPWQRYVRVFSQMT